MYLVRFLSLNVGCVLFLSTPKYSVLELWKTDLKQINEKAAEALADPKKYPNLFPDLDWALQVQHGSWTLTFFHS